MTDIFGLTPDDSVATPQDLMKAAASRPFVGEPGQQTTTFLTVTCGILLVFIIASVALYLAHRRRRDMRPDHAASDVQAEDARLHEASTIAKDGTRLRAVAMTFGATALAGTAIEIDFLLGHFFWNTGYAVSAAAFLTLPLTASLVGAQLGELAWARFGHYAAVSKFQPLIWLRAFGLIEAGWVVIYLGTVYVVQPFGTYWTGEEWAGFYRWLCVPPILIFLLVLFALRVRKILQTAGGGKPAV